MIDTEALRAWLKLLRYGKPVSIRGFQRLMGYKSPAKAQRILERLYRYGLVEKTSSNDYIAVKDIPPYLAAYIVVKGFVLPRTLIYAVYATTTVSVYLFLAKPPLYIVILLIALIIPYWLEILHNIQAFRKLIGEER